MQIQVQLRPLETADLLALFAMESQAEGRWMAAFVSEKPLDWEAFESRYRRILGDDAITKCAIVVDGSVVGSIMCFPMEGQPTVCYWVANAFWGRGIASAALQLFLKHITVRPLFASVVGDNVGSIRVLVKNGFVECGRARDHATGRGQVVEEVFFKLD